MVNDPIPTIGATQQTKLCAITGAVLVPVLNQGIQRGGAQDVQLNLHVTPCYGDKCMFWSQVRKDCSIKLAAEALVDLKDKLGVMAAFGGKK